MTLEKITEIKYQASNVMITEVMNLREDYENCWRLE